MIDIREWSICEGGLTVVLLESVIFSEGQLNETNYIACSDIIAHLAMILPISAFTHSFFQRTNLIASFLLTMSDSE